MPGGKFIASVLILLTGTAAAQTAQQPPATELPPVEVIGASPLIGSGAERAGEPYRYCRATCVPRETSVR